MSTLLSASALLVAPSPAWSQDGDPGPQAVGPEGEAGGDPFAALPWQTEGVGKLGSRALLKIPDGYRFLDGKNAGQLLVAMGNLSSGDELGLIGPPSLDWFVVYFFDDIGYVKDEDKDDLDPDALLESIGENMAAANEYRREQGMPEFHLEGWAIPPRYNQDTNMLEWAENFRVEGQLSVNYKTRVLGRSGVVKVILATDPELLEGSIPKYRQMMTGFEFNEGERYSEFRAGDKVAEYGLAALVVGGGAAMAAKAGLLTPIIMFFKKGMKFIVVGVLALGAMLKGIFSRKKEE